MRHSTGTALAILVFLGTFFTFTGTANAVAVLTKPFGGMVTATQMGNIICRSGMGPVTQKSAGQSPTFPYVYQYGKQTPPSSGKYVLGLYSTIPDYTSCYIQAGPYQVPYKMNRVTLYGTSK